MTTKSDEARPGAGPPIRVQIRFERFPTSVRGAFVMRGADGNPHDVRLASAWLARVPDGRDKPVSVEDRAFDVAPVMDLFVPFEVPVADLEPGWYRVETEARVDGGRSWTFQGRLFTMPWPRSDVRRGIVPVGRTVAVGTGSVEVDRVEMTADSAVVVWRWAGAEAGAEGASDPPVDLLLRADGQALPALPPEASSKAAEPRTGERRAMTYPVPKACGSLAVVVRVGREESDPVPVPLA
jgi:hypothetical protein